MKYNGKALTHSCAATTASEKAKKGNTIQRERPYMLKAMLYEAKSNALRARKQCFESLKALLLEPESNALRTRKHCTEKLKAMLWEPKDNALALYKQCS